MSVTHIETDRVHRLPWPYSHAIKAGDLLFVAGQVGLDKNLNLVGPNDIEAQTRQAWENIRAIVEAAGGKVTDVISVTTFLKHIEHAESVQRVRREYFPQGKYPVATVVEVSRLGLEGLLVEIQVIAYLGERKGK